MTYRIFIDGAAGTTGLQVKERLAAHPSVTPVTLDDAQRKDAAARREICLLYTSPSPRDRG